MAGAMHGAAGAALVVCGPATARLGTPSDAPGPAWPIAMWTVMAVAMMLPTALPLVLLFGRLRRGRYPALGIAGPTALLVLGYLGAWCAFALAAAALQLGLARAGLAGEMGELHGAALGGATLAGAGLFQLTPLKRACLSRCRSPLMFLMTRWRDGRAGPFAMGVDHGLWCLGCCWALMLVMLVAGVMNVLWMAALTALMTVEKVVPRGDRIARAAGVALLASGLALAAIG
jgi:predicted metal-binding membrane protein